MGDASLLQFKYCLQVKSKTRLKSHSLGLNFVDALAQLEESKAKLPPAIVLAVNNNSHKTLSWDIFVLS